MIAAVESGLVWRAPAAFALLAALFVLVILRLRRRGGVALAAGDSLSGGASLPVTWRARAASVPLALEVLGVIAVIVATARPVVVDVEPPSRLGRDVLLCIDRSSSMAATDLDLQRSRLEVARAVAADFLSGREDDRLGIVSFARFADLVCPPTADHAAVLELLDAVDLVEADGPEDKTAIGAAVGMAANLLQRSAAPSKVIVLLTDGEENVAAFGARDQIAPLHAGQWCRDHGVRVHAIAVGRGEQGAAGGWRALDTTAVQQLAKISGGRFFAAADARALRAVYDEIDELEAAHYAEPGVRVTECFATPLLCALALWLLAYWLRPTFDGGRP
ncbi:MAG: VWA domain-containing protein [Planctomycetota bacterium]|nr:VWA domain-containing protein [Planctomycetota bacterium]